MAQRKRSAVDGPDLDEPPQLQDGRRGCSLCTSGLKVEDGACHGATVCPLCEADEFHAWGLRADELKVDHDQPLGAAAVLGDVFAGKLLRSGKVAFQTDVAVTEMLLEGSPAAEGRGAGGLIADELDMLCRMTRQVRWGVVNVQGYRWLPRTKTLWVATELVDGGDLLAWMRECGGRLSARDAVWVGVQVSYTLSKLHALCVAHGSISPSSIMRPRPYGRSCVYLSGVGMWRLCSEVLGLQVPTDRLDAYRAPQQTPLDLLATKQADVWALAATMLHALTGQRPGSEGGGVEGPPAIPPDVPPQLADILRDCFSDVPRERPTAAQLNDRLISVYAALNGVDNEGRFRVFVKTLTGKTLILDTSWGALVWDVKLRIQDKEGIPPNNMHIIFAGKQLEECMPLGACGVENECTLHLVLPLRGC